ncbi:MAG: hypothetical protein AAGI37_00025 [Planctomycetota bacterium]
MDQGNHRPRFSYPLLTCMLLIAAMLMTPALTGCGAITKYKRDKQLQAVAKDWNKTIRASQVIPVYPTTEDLQPGDIFLVTLTVNEQQKAWEGNDYLPLDNHIDRLNPTGYVDFYKNSFFNTAGANGLPRPWLEPGDNTKAWAQAPMAYFPAYSFSTSVSGGASAAFPVSGIPIGLDLLGSGTATVTVQISDARTIGIDLVSMYKQVKKWEAQNSDLLANYAPPHRYAEPKYIRVLTRVYLAKKMNVGIRDASVFSAAGSAGAARPIDTILAKVPENNAKTNATTAENYKSAIDNLNALIGQGSGSQGNKQQEEGQSGEASEAVTPPAPPENPVTENPAEALPGGESLLPGGSVKVVSASSGSITLDETFKRPVVIGYLAFDMAIGEGGILGPPIPTLAVFENQATPLMKQTSGERLTSLSVYSQAYKNVRDQAAQGDPSAEVIQSELIDLADEVFKEIGHTPQGSSDSFIKLIAYVGKIEAGRKNKDKEQWLLVNQERLDMIYSSLTDNQGLLRRTLLFGAGLQ